MEEREELKQRREKLPTAEQEVLRTFDRANALMGEMERGGWSFDVNNAVPFLGLLVAALERADERAGKAAP